MTNAAILPHRVGRLDKGYGFIQPDGGGKDVFVHIKAVARSGLTGLADNQKVSYELETGRDGRESAGSIGLL